MRTKLLLEEGITVTPQAIWYRLKESRWSWQAGPRIPKQATIHKSVARRLSDRLVFKFLPPYSPELNPVERFFEELRRVTANRIFNTLFELEAALMEAVNKYCNDKESVRQLCGYPWILEQLQPKG